MARDRSFLLLPLVALVVVSPLIVQGCSCGHDFDFHLISWFEASHQLVHGVFPHWTFTPAWNAGEPRFVFYPPLSWLLGALLGLVMPWTWTPVAYTWISLTAAGLTLYHAARHYASPRAALLAATIYLANPYTLYTAYERTAYAELLAAAWLPLALHAVLKRRITIPSIALSVALLWLTNAPAAVMGCYAMAAVILLRTLAQTRPDPLLTESSPLQLATHSIAGVLLGLGLSSFYVIPAAYERRFVQINFAILPGLRPWDNFLFQHTADPQHDAVLHTASIVAIALLALTSLVFLWSYSTSRHSGLSKRASISSRFNLLLVALAATILFMLTPLSAPLWHHLPELRFLQFPWRFLAVLAVVFGLASVRPLAHLHLKPTPAIATAFLVTLFFTFSANHFFRQFCYLEDTIPQRLAVFQSSNPGTDPTDEYTPVGADNDSLSQTNPGYWLAATATAPAPSSSAPAAAPRQLNLSLPSPAILILNLRNYPAWHILRNDSLVTTRLQRQDGLIAIPLPAGPSHLKIVYATTLDQSLGYLVTAISAATLAALLLRRRIRPQS